MMKTATAAAAVYVHHLCNNNRKIRRKISWGKKVLKKILNKRLSKRCPSRKLLNKTRGGRRKLPPSSSGAIQVPNPVMELTNDLVVEILTWLPGKPLGRCKCVCKAWRSIIRSPEFLKAYQSRQPGLILCSAEKIDISKQKQPPAIFRLRCFYSTLWTWQLKEPKEGFSCLYELNLSLFLNGMTQVVNGLICVCEYDGLLTLHNIYTGQSMRLPYPELYDDNLSDCISTFHLGYDQTNKIYKLLRLMIGKHRAHGFDHRLQAEILILRPSTLLSTWRKLDYNSSGLADLLWENAPFIDPGPRRSRNSDLAFAKTFAMHGVLYWFVWPQFMFSFDLNKEKFEWIEAPKDLCHISKSLGPSWKFAQWMGCLALWLPPSKVDNRLRVFLLDDGEHKRWREHFIPVPKYVADIDTIATGNPLNGELLLMNPKMVIQENHMPIYSYNLHTRKFDMFKTYKLPLADLDRLTGVIPFPISWGRERRRPDKMLLAWVSCLQDNRFASLDDVLSGAAAGES